MLLREPTVPSGKLKQVNFWVNCPLSDRLFVKARKLARALLNRYQPNRRKDDMAIFTSGETKSIRSYQDPFLRDELKKIDAACDRFFLRRGVTARRSTSYRRAKAA